MGVGLEVLRLHHYFLRMLSTMKASTKSCLRDKHTFLLVEGHTANLELLITKISGWYVMHHDWNSI